MKFKCDVLKFDEGRTWLGVSIGGSLKKGSRQLNLQLDLFKRAVIFSIQQNGLKFTKGV